MTTSSAIRQRVELLINGDWTDGGDRAVSPVIDPCTEQPVGEVTLATLKDAERAVATARQAFDDAQWASVEPSRRAAVLDRVADGLEQRIDELIAAVRSELGQADAVAGARVRAAVGVWRNAARVLEQTDFEAPTAITDGRDAVVRRVPRGVVLAITAWNSPLLLASMKLAPAFAAGCTVVLKPAAETPLTMPIFGEVMLEAGIPPAAISILAADPEVTAHLVDQPGADMVSFTGSTAVGALIMQACGRRIARVALELGGKSPAIVMPGADPDTTIPLLIDAAGLPTAGQVCTARTRFLVPRAEYGQWTEALAGALARLRVGPPDLDGVQIGPLAFARHRDRVESWIATGVTEGATLASGGGRPDGLDRGFFVEPTLFTGVDNEMQIAREEIFGPVMCLIGYEDVDDAVRIANDSRYGLASSVFGPDLEQARAAGRRLRAGSVHVNTAGASYDLPSGGFKQSGIGREGSFEGIEEFLEVQQLIG